MNEKTECSIFNQPSKGTLKFKPRANKQTPETILISALFTAWKTTLISTLFAAWTQNRETKEDTMNFSEI